MKDEQYSKDAYTEVIEINPSNFKYKVLKKNDGNNNHDIISERIKKLVSNVGKKAKSISIEKPMEDFIKTKEKENEKEGNIIDLNEHLENIIGVFENTLEEIRQSSFKEQERKLNGYKKLLNEQINIINARLTLIKKISLS